MSKYSITTPIPSCKVSKTTIEEIEDYIKKVVAPLGENKPDKETPTTVTISDSTGREEITSIKDFDRSSFPNDTEGIVIELSDYGKTTIIIEVKLHRNKMFSELRISYDGPQSREVVSGLNRELMTRIEPYKTNHYLFHSGLGHLMAMGLVLVGLLPMLSWDQRSASVRKVMLGVFITTVFIVSLYGAMILLKPYTSFDTRRNEVNEKRANWIILGIVGFFLFTVIGVYLRQRLFGF